MAYAGFWRRFAAVLVDGIVIGVPLGLVLSFVVDLKIGTDDLLAELLITIVAQVYFAAFESSPRQATIGKMALGIYVANERGERISFLRALGRNVGKNLSSLILNLGFIMAAFTARKQALHDMLAKTIVLKR